MRAKSVLSICILVLANVASIAACISSGPDKVNGQGEEPVTADDRTGVFVMLDRAVPSRLLAAFPEGVPIERVPLAQATEATARFLGTGDA